MIQDEITLNDLKKMPKESYVLVDMRGSVAFSHGHIPHAVSIPVDQLEEQVWKNENVIIYCSIGEQSREVVRHLREKGVNACNLKGGFREWLMEEERLLDKDELDRYSRQIILPEVGIEGQKKLKNARVLIVGAGGLGSPAALYLGAAGIGTIGIADGDVVSMSNLHRQIVHDTASVGLSKVESAKCRLEAINPHIQVITYQMPVTADNIGDIIKDYDFIIDGADNFQTKFLINDACVIAGKPFCHAGILRFDGQVMTWVPGKRPCYRCIFEDIPEGDSIPNCASAGIIGAMAGVIGSFQALEAVKYILGIGELLTGRMLIVDGLTMRCRIAEFREPSKECRVCGEHPVIRDVREWKEYYTIPGCRL